MRATSPRSNCFEDSYLSVTGPIAVAVFGRLGNRWCLLLTKPTV